MGLRLASGWYPVYYPPGTHLAHPGYTPPLPRLVSVMHVGSAVQRVNKAVGLKSVAQLT